MANQITSQGLETDTLDEVIAYLTTQFQNIYGADINLDSSTPDGQIINIFAQAVVDLEDLLTQIYSGFDPDLAIGVTLDQRVALNGIQRQGGTNTITPVSITTDRALNLNGLDNAYPSLPLFVVADNAGNNWQLIISETIAAAGTYNLNFQAEVPGEVLTTPNTITVPVTFVLGVSGINNPTTYTSLGVNEESDASLRLRRQKAVSLSSKGYLAGLLAALQNINGVVNAFVYENTSGVTDSDGVPGHSIWVIVEGGSSAEIADAIYSKRNAGCGMKGDIEFTITQVDGSLFVVRWDDVETEDLHIEFDAESINGIDPVNATLLKNGLVTSLVPGVYETVDINEIATKVQAIDPNVLVTNAGLAFSGGGPFESFLTPTAKNKRFIVEAINIDITVI